MELIVFDLDGTLLNRESAISEFTSETLSMLAERDIAYTVATGRTLHSARAILEGHRFTLPQAYKNGVMIWHPDQDRLAGGALLTVDELDRVVQACIRQSVTPFVFTLEKRTREHRLSSALQSEIEKKLIRNLGLENQVVARSLDELPGNAAITHVNSIGESDAIQAVLQSVNDVPHLVAYSGYAWEGNQWRWLDVHHSDASKGGAIQLLKELVGIDRVVCFWRQRQRPEHVRGGR